VEVAGMQKIVDPLLVSVERFALRKLVVVVREIQVDACENSGFSSKWLVGK
jgi:hypothetical protein